MPKIGIECNDEAAISYQKAKYSTQFSHSNTLMYSIK